MTDDQAQRQPELDVTDEELVVIEDSLRNLTALMESGAGDAEEATLRMMEHRQMQLRQIVQKVFGENTEKVCEFLADLIQAPLQGYDYCKVQNDDALQGVVAQMKEYGLLESSPEDEGLVKLVL